MTPMRCEPAIPGSEHPQTLALDLSAAGISEDISLGVLNHDKRRDDLSASRPDRFTPEERAPGNHLNRRLCGLQCQHGIFGVETYIALAGNRTTILPTPASSRHRLSDDGITSALDNTRNHCTYGYLSI
jgi:hypothetical protein